MGLFESIADRRIRAAREEGFLDDLAGAGKPIPDLDRERRPGWWAASLVKRERSMIRAEELDRTIKAAKPGLWRLQSEGHVLARIGELNADIDEYNRTTTWERRDRLDPTTMLAQWRRLRSPMSRSANRRR